MKKLTIDDIKVFRDRLQIPVSDAQIEADPYSVPSQELVAVRAWSSPVTTHIDFAEAEFSGAVRQPVDD